MHALEASTLIWVIKFAYQSYDISISYQGINASHQQICILSDERYCIYTYLSPDISLEFTTSKI